MAAIFLRLHLVNPRPLYDRFLRFIALCFFYEIVIINNAAFRHGRGDVYGARLMDLRNR